MLRGRIDPGKRVHIEALSRRDPNNPPLTAFHHLLGDPLRQQEWPNHIDLKLMAYVGPRDVENRTTLQNAGIVYQDFDAPVERFLPISFIDNVKLFNLQVDPACRCLPFQGLDLGIDLDCGDYIESLFRKSHCGLVSKARACSCNQDPLHWCLLSSFSRFSN